MKFFLPIIFLLGISRNVLGKGIRRERSNIEDELSYQELINMNVSCYPWDSCTENRTDDSPVPEYGGKCSCHSQCWEYGMCCIDSPYRVKPPIQKCLRTGYMSYYMVYRCPDNTHPDLIWRSHCERESNGIDDILMIAPVTSLDTSRTYKNYYCFRCHETTDNYVSWNLNLEVKRHRPEDSTEVSVYSVAYNQTKRTWVAILDESHASLRVSLVSFVFPDNVQADAWRCDYFNLFQYCPGSADERLNAKCLAYSAVVSTTIRRYKNVHCALCNDVSLDSLSCIKFPERFPVRPGFAPNLRCLMDINGGGKDKKCFKKEDKPETCKGDYEVWNSYTKKCQKTSCIKPGYVRKNDMCVKV